MAPRVVTPRSAEPVAGVVRLAPAPDLADVVAEHWVVAWDRRGAPPMTQEVLPDPCVNLAVEPLGIRLYGVVTGRSDHVLEGAGMVVGCKFRPGGLSGYVDGPVRALTDRIVPLVDVWGADGAALAARIESAPTVSGIIAAVTEFLRVRRPAPDPGRAFVARVVDAMATAGRDARVAGIADRFGVSTRTLQRLFAEHVGAGPKDVLRQFRLQEATERLPEEGAGLARLAAELGYFDQAHFTREFRATLGRTPAQAAS